MKIFSKTQQKKPIGLVILDGWGIAPAWGGNAISRGRTVTFDKIMRSFPSTSLLASGDAVGLPTNAPGNSEAGHLNIGAGKIVHQDVSLIDSQIDSGEFEKNKTLHEALNHSKKNNSAIHLMGLLSRVGTHSHIRHLYALLNFFKNNDFNKVNIHLFSDGRDSPPMDGIELVSEVENKIKEIGVGKIASISGRFYAMDRDNRWGRISRAYNMLVKGEGKIYDSAVKAFSRSYAYGETDEFISPLIIANKSNKIETISNNDAIIIFNFRGDRIRELVRAFLETKISQFPDRKKLKNLFIASFAIYDDGSLAKQVFYPEIVCNPLAKVWSEKGLKQFHIAETEKYPHITYYLNGGVSKPFLGEQRLMIPSPKNVKTYDYKPEMSAKKVTTNLISQLRRNIFDIFAVNFANPDMVGHSGNLKATIDAVETVDLCLGSILNRAIKSDGTVFVTADHGNAEQMVNPRTGQPDTEHTTNPVPFIIVSADKEIRNLKLRSDGILASVAPTILEVMGINQPLDMINQSLIIKQNC